MKSNIKKIRQEFINGIRGKDGKEPVLPVYDIQFNISSDQLYNILSMLDKINDFILDNRDESYSHNELIEYILDDVDEANECIELFVDKLISSSIKYEVPLAIISQEIKCDDEYTMKLVDKYVYDSIDVIGKRIKMLEDKMIKIPYMILGISEEEF